MKLSEEILLGIQLVTDLTESHDAQTTTIPRDDVLDNLSLEIEHPKREKKRVPMGGKNSVRGRSPPAICDKVRGGTFHTIRINVSTGK